MASHAALGVVRAGVAVLKGSGVRVNCISPGQIDVGVDLQGVGQRDVLQDMARSLTIGVGRPPRNELPVPTRESSDQGGEFVGKS